MSKAQTNMLKIGGKYDTRNGVATFKVTGYNRENNEYDVECIRADNTTQWVVGERSSRHPTGEWDLPDNGRPEWDLIIPAQSSELSEIIQRANDLLSNMSEEERYMWAFDRMVDGLRSGQLEYENNE